ncbi:MAG: glycosyltransferase family 2 protein [Ignavibacteriales bacterium]|nr:glycosyltransferase family 2 protein [Ignavibacteriales bacterium]
MISVVMPLYNNEKEVQRAIASVLFQSIQQFELIIVNDGSTDNSLYVVQSLRDERITVIHQKNQGVSAARNIGIRAAKYGLIALLDADDEWKPDFLKTIVALSEEFSECSIFATGYYYMDQNGSQRNSILRGISPLPFKGVLSDYFSIAAQSDPPLWSSAIAVRKPAFESVGLFPVGITIGEDLLTWARLAVKYSIAYTSERHAIFHLKAPLAGTPSRIPQEPDRVGTELVEMLHSLPVDKKESFERYIALWHRMRAAMYLGLHDRSKTFREVRHSVRYDPVNIKTYAYAAIASLPNGIRTKLYDVFSYLKIQQRKTIA